MGEPLRLLIHGASGRMGQSLLRLAAEKPDRFVVVAAVSRKPQQRVVDEPCQLRARDCHAGTVHGFRARGSREGCDPQMRTVRPRRTLAMSISNPARIVSSARTAGTRPGAAPVSASPSSAVTA